MHLASMEMPQYPPGPQPSIQRQHRSSSLLASFDEGDGTAAAAARGGAAFIGTTGELLPLSRVPPHPMNDRSVESSSGYSHSNSEYYRTPTSHSILAPVPANRTPSMSNNNLPIPQDKYGIASTKDRSVLHNATRSSSTASNDSIYRPTTAPRSYDPALLPTPPPEPHSSLPKFTMPPFDFREFARSDVYPYGVETPGLIHSPGEEDYFGEKLHCDAMQ